MYGLTLASGRYIELGQTYDVMDALGRGMDLIPRSAAMQAFGVMYELLAWRVGDQWTQDEEEELYDALVRFTKEFGGQLTGDSRKLYARLVAAISEDLGGMEAAAGTVQ